MKIFDYLKMKDKPQIELSKVIVAIEHAEIIKDIEFR